jgi:glucoamylase
MPRDIPVGNGDMLVTFDRKYRIRDLYWPHVGMPNHTGGHVQHFGVWADGDFAWVEEDSWTRSMRYKPDTMVTEVVLRNEQLGLELHCEDAVDYNNPVYLRSIRVCDLRGSAREVRVFFHHDISIGGFPVGDTVNYDPKTMGLVHYKDGCYFLVNGCDSRKCGIDHFATGTKRLGEAEGTWRDAEDGQLVRSAISQGSVDSTIGFDLKLQPGGEEHLVYWIAAADSYKAARELNQKVLDRTAERMIRRTEAYWRLWACKEPLDFSPLPEPLRDHYVRSELILRTQVDHDGAIIAANDTDITHFAGDTYSYMWPRDGAICCQSLVLAGHSELSRRFFRFCQRVVEPEGYFLHKYNPTGTLASSWHPWLKEGRPSLPIQQDETALVVWALRRHFEVFRDVEFIREVHRDLVSKPAEWILSFRDHNGLPQPSWDLWEERYGVHLFTVATCIGALEASRDFADDFGAAEESAKYGSAADQMRAAMIKHMWCEETGHFARTVTLQDDGTYTRDMTLDASAWGLFAFNALPPQDPRVASHMEAVRARLTVDTEIGGVARYENDYYHQVESTDTNRVPGNPWAICTLWMAQYDIAIATTVEQLQQSVPVLEWTRERSLESGVVAEQFDPYSGAPISVSPLTWSHATIMTTIVQYLLKHAALTGKPAGTVAELTRTRSGS